ncbi:hypothetical protein IP92_02945 [Pseudoduganella flava]|uniref:Uncharacterized protein n=1 Tax=Pseudoduganella flava TaxID=871742 RepID=A0A562PR92_9BURK|nr:hypothetical protein [Pseudoduganella flava]QGZ37775.1 hypothetical protein GO485_01020 [Pseudoduganella flava]TWI46586.1 hypothetical protein IP92_02945 [Pseudoduganella flava]
MNRFTEPSTWAGIAAVFQVLKSFLPAHNHMYADALTAAAAALAGALPERTKAAQ